MERHHAPAVAASDVDLRETPVVIDFVAADRELSLEPAGHDSSCAVRANVQIGGFVLTFIPRQRARRPRSKPDAWHPDVRAPIQTYTAPNLKSRRPWKAGLRLT